MSNITKSYNDFSVTFEDMNGEIWFNATQAAKHFGKEAHRWLELESAKEYVSYLQQVYDPAKNGVLIRIVKGKGKQQGTWMHRDLAVEFARWLDVRFAIAFNRMVEDILLGRTVRNETLKRILLDVPCVWQKTFPDQFFEALLKCWCDESVQFNRANGTPSFCGWFINKFIYDYLWAGLPNELKARRKEFSTDTDESLYKLHQFLTEACKEKLRDHTSEVTGMLKGNQSKEGFKHAFFNGFLNPNQIGMKI